MRVWIIVLVFLLALRLFLNQRQTSLVPSTPFVVEFILDSEPKLGLNSQRIIMNGYDILLPRYPELSYGDKLRIFVENISCQQLNGSSASNFTERCSAIFPKVEILDRNAGNFIISGLIDLRRQIFNLYLKYLPAKEAGLIGGIALGYKNGLSAELKNDLKVVGLSHVAVASGMNLAIVGGAVLSLAGMVLNKRRALLVATVFVWFYAVFAGFEAPVIRAAVMVSLTNLAVLTGRQSSGWLVLGITIWVMLMIFPRWLWDIGFQLSVLATVGVMAVGQIKWLKPFGESFSQTLGATLLTLPVTVASFGTVSLVAIPVNVLVLWAVTPMTILGMTMSVFGPLGYVIYPIAHFFVGLVELVGSKKSFLLNVAEVVPAVWLGYYLILFSIYKLCVKK